MMIEKNSLYRKLTMNNLFRTFSKSYSRQIVSQTAQRSQTTQKIISSNQIESLKILNKSTKTQDIRRQKEKQSLTGLYLTKADQTIRSENLRYDTDLPLKSYLLPENRQVMTQYSKYTQETERQKQGFNQSQTHESLLYQRKNKESFKLKSCTKKEEFSEEFQDNKADFSTLEPKMQSKSKQRGQLTSQLIKKRSQIHIFKNNKYLNSLQQKILGKYSISHSQNQVGNLGYQPQKNTLKHSGA